MEVCLARARDAKHYKLDIGAQFCTAPPYYHMELWVKNDNKNIYFLYKIEYPRELLDKNDGGQISYWWPYWDSNTGWAHSDMAYVGLDGYVGDFYGWADSWHLDTQAAPLGKNNVVGTGISRNGYYWFEFSKPLSSNDGYDWSLIPGGTYGLRGTVPDKGDNMAVELWDSSANMAYNRDIILSLSISPWKR